MYHIHQITSPVVCGPHRVGQWWCADSKIVEGESLSRYLQADGTWGRNTHYFNTVNELHQVLSLGFQPDFSLSKEDKLSRQLLKDWQDSEYSYDNYFDDEVPDYDENNF